MAGILSQGGILMQSSLIEEKLNKRRRWLWYLYDVGNSAYAAVVILAIYAAYF
jgi:MFS-type transporter involved in bile tolerance (Atg22 family)